MTVRYLKKTGVDMSSFVNLVKSEVNLDSYSSSANFCGFCFSKIGWGKKKCLEALLDIASEIVGELHVVSSLTICTSLLENENFYALSEESKKRRNYLVDLDFIKLNDSDASANYFHSDKVVSKNEAYSLIEYQTSIGGAIGHVFFVSLTNGVIIYPHDDCGMGFFCSSEPKKRDDFLSLVKRSKEKYSDILSFDLK